MKDESLPLIPPSDRAQSRDEIAAEIADHLAAAEADLTKRGVAAEEARAAARKKFGDVEKIQKTCYWIRNGETIMLRWTLVSLAAVLCILLGLSVLGNWRTQSHLADEMGKLSAELKALAAAKQTPPPVPQPPEITGVIYAGSKDKPVAGASIAILRGDGGVVRRTTSDTNGGYRSGPLESGDFFITAPLESASDEFAKRVVQSEPIFIHSASGVVRCDLDAHYPAGCLDISIDHKLPQARKNGKYLITSRLSVFVIRSRERDHLWTAKEDVPAAWPVFSRPYSSSQSGINFNSSTFSSNGLEINGIVPASQFLLLAPGESRHFHHRGSNETRMFPDGETGIEGTLHISVVPLNEDGEIVMNASQFNTIRNSFGNIQESDAKRVKTDDGVTNLRLISLALFSEEGSYGWQHLSGGWAWLAKLKNFSPVSAPTQAVKNPPRHKIIIKEGHATKILFKIPADIEEEIIKAVESTIEPEKFESLIRDRFFRRILTFEVVGSELLEKKSGASKTP